MRLLKIGLKVRIPVYILGGLRCRLLLGRVRLLLGEMLIVCSRIAEGPRALGLGRYETPVWPLGIGGS